MKQKLFNLSFIRYIFGILLFMESIFMMAATGVSAYYCHTAGDSDFWALLFPTLLTMCVGTGLWYSGRKHNESITLREGFLIVALAWVFFSIFGMLPYLLYGTTDNLTDAFFETISGFSTTGATILENIDSQPHGILFWRSLTQWIGGLGIVVFTLALLPIIGNGGTQMFNAEVTGLGVDKLRPKIQSTSRHLWSIYLGLTIICGVLYFLGDMSSFDAVCHALSTMATGGFSTHQASIGYFQSSYIEYVCIAFMFISSLNYSLFYTLGIGRWKRFWRNEEFRWFVVIVLGFTLLFMFLQWVTRISSHTTHETLASLPVGFEATLRTCLFHTVAIISSSGFQATHFDYSLWGAIFWMPTLVLMVVGGCAGSTAGGLKVIRFVILLKNTINEFVRQIHPRMVTTVRFGGHTVASEIVQKVLAFIFIFMMLIVFGCFFMQCLGLSFETALGSTVSALGNTGPALGATGPAFTWASIPDAGKWFAAFLMLVGRLEIFTVILLFTSMFWRK